MKKQRSNIPYMLNLLYLYFSKKLYFNTTIYELHLFETFLFNKIIIDFNLK